MMKFTILLFVLFSLTIASCTSNSNKHKGIAEQDSLTYEILLVNNSLNGCEPDSLGCTYIEFSYPQFQNAKGKLGDSLELLLRNTFRNEEKNITSIDSVQQDFLAQYALFKKEQKDYNTPWNITKNIYIINQNNKWITLAYCEESFTGGAHPNSYLLYTMLDKKTGHKLLLTDFFDSTSIYKLMVIGEPIFRGVKGIGPSLSLAEAGYWFPNNRFQLNNNFYINDDGLTFYYNNYEVGPYVVGPTSITLPADKLIKLLKK